MNDEERLETLLTEAEANFDDGDLEGAAELLDDLLESVDETTPDVSPDALADALRLRASIHAELREDEASFLCLDRVDALLPGDVPTKLQRARLQLLRGEVDSARLLAQGLGKVDPELACEVLDLRAEIAERQGDLAEADRLFAAARDLHPEGHLVPVRLDPDLVEHFAAETIESLPANIRKTLDNVMITLQEFPDPGSEASFGDLLGIYEGHTLFERDSALLPDRIQLYLRNIERAGSTREEVFEQLRITLLHEIGHHLGLDEDDLDRLGLG